jgi:hypothetical protein
MGAAGSKQAQHGRTHCVDWNGWVGVRNEGVELQPATCTLPFKGDENKIKYSSDISNVNCYEDQAIQQTLSNFEWHNVSH